MLSYEFQDGRVRKLILEGDRKAAILDPAPSGKISQHINDPRFGGFGCFGVHVARRNEFFPDLGRVYDWTWDITERMNAKDNGGFGVTASYGTDKEWTTLLSDGESPIIAIKRVYDIRPHSFSMNVAVRVVWDGSGNPLYFKEPKLVCHSLHGYRYLWVGNKKHDLMILPKPSVRTLQIRDPKHLTVKFTGTRPPITVVLQGSGWNDWRKQADESEPLVSMTHGQRYCQQGPPSGHLTSAWEAAHWPTLDAAGIMFHAWEGGSGYSDCLSCFRPAIPNSRYEVELTIGG